LAELIARFAGEVSCARGASPSGLTLTGVARTPTGEPTTVSFATTEVVMLPRTLTDAEVERIAGGQYRIRAGGREWLLAARGAEVHRDVGAPFYKALPPRPVPAGKRLFWRLVLALAASRAGLALLRALRR
jgi:hypothetical protein